LVPICTNWTSCYAFLQHSKNTHCGERLSKHSFSSVSILVICRHIYALHEFIYFFKVRNLLLLVIYYKMQFSSSTRISNHSSGSQQMDCDLFRVVGRYLLLEMQFDVKSSLLRKMGSRVTMFCRLLTTQHWEPLFYRVNRSTLMMAIE